jgi:hypothetical protein
MKWIWIILTLTVSPVVWGAAQKPKTPAPPKTVRMVVRETEEAGGMARSSNITYLFKDGKLRMERLNDIHIINNAETLTIPKSVTDKMAMWSRTRREQQASSTMEGLKKWFDKPNLKKQQRAGKGKLLGRTVELYNIPDSRGEIDNFWVYPFHGAKLAFKSISHLPKGLTIIREVIRFEVDVPLDDALFQLPDGYQRMTYKVRVRDGLIEHVPVPVPDQDTPSSVQREGD